MSQGGDPARPKRTVVESPQEEQAQLLAALRRARYGSVLALHLLVWCAAGRHPTDIAAGLFCSRSRVYRTVRAYRAGTLGLEHDDQGQRMPQGRTTVLLPTRRRSLLALLKAPPRAHGWCRTRWRCATLAATVTATRGLTRSAETMRRWLHEVGWVWTRAKLVAQDDDPPRVKRLARLRCVYEPLPRWEAMVLADELDLQWLPTVGDAGRPQGTQVEGRTPGTHATHDLGGALDLATGTRSHGVGPRHTNGLFRAVRQTLEAASPAAPYQRRSVGVDHDKLHQAKAVEAW